MSCREKQEEILLDYCAKTLDPERTASFEKHLEGCAECRRTVQEQTALWQALDIWTPPAVSSGFDGRLMARIADENATSFWTRWNWKLIAVAAVLVIALLVRIPHHAPDSGNRIDIEQVEQTLDDLEVLTPGS